MKHIKLIIDCGVLEEYNKYYFEHHPKAHKEPIQHPYHESINTWMIMKRPMMNALKGKWKEFIVWFIEREGYTNLRIDDCRMEFTTYYYTNRRHDIDNSCPKFILDGMSESGFIVDDDYLHLHELKLRIGVDVDNPRTEIDIYYK